MRAAIFQKYGPPEVLHIAEVPQPLPAKDEILVELSHSGVTSGDARIRGSRFPSGFGLVARLVFGPFAPRKQILGISFAGKVKQVGSEVKLFAVGDEVFGMTGGNMATYAEYITIKEDKAVAKVPAGVRAADACAMVFGGTTALFFLRDKANLQPGQSILINGASGAVGTNAVQIAKTIGAEVIGVTSAKNSELVKSLGAERTIDYTSQPLETLTEKFDVVFDTVGNLSIEQGKRLLKPGGMLLLAVPGLGQILKINLSSHGGFRVSEGSAPERKQDLEFLADLMVQGKLKAVIEKVYPLDQVAEAHRLVDSGRKVGNVVLEI